MAAHMRKRPFQPSITSYFDRRENPTSHQSHESGSVSPLLPPPHVQASLLSVGMRVRKSVPEGYKTHKTTPAQAGFDVSTRHGTSATMSQDTSRTVTRSSELKPFCGLHKVGGHATQPHPSQSSTDPDDISTSAHLKLGSTFMLDADASQPPSLTSSQDSILSTTSMPARPQQSNKRAYEPDLDDSIPTTPPPDPDLFISPKTQYRISHTSMPDLSSTSPLYRPFARHRARKKASVPNDGDAVVVVEDVSPAMDGLSAESGRLGVDLDFEDAPFLVREDVDMDGGW
ncbi:hypothetical protein LTR66_013974 [Elasticomyces elasticus]|nr:hypothetical protein LTR66_013974 [Elasticomyces elasticus]